MKTHGIKIDRPFLMLAIFLFLDIVTVWGLEIFDSSLFFQSAPIIIGLWLIGFINNEFKA